jgi:hypothetical protein
VRDGFISAGLAFVAVLVLAAAFRPPGPPETTPTPVNVLPPIKCGIPEADCQKLGSAIAAQARAANPGRTITVIVIDGYDTFEICFSDGSCESTSSGGAVNAPGGVIAPVPGFETPGPEVETPTSP